MVRYFNGSLTFAGPDGDFTYPVYMAHPDEDAFATAIREAVAAVVVSGTPPEVTGASGATVALDEKTATILCGYHEITPETDLSTFPADAQAFVTAVYAFNDGEQRKVWEALQIEVVEPEREPVPLTAEEEKALATAKIIKDFESGVKALTSGYTDDEVKSWDAKRRESEIILAGSGEPTPTIDALIAVLGVDRTEYAQTIQAKVVAYGTAYGTLEANMKKSLESL